MVTASFPAAGGTCLFSPCSLAHTVANPVSTEALLSRLIGMPSYIKAMTINGFAFFIAMGAMADYRNLFIEAA